MPDLSDLFESGKKLILILCAIFGVFIAAVIGLKIYKNVTADKTPIVSITAKNNEIYRTTDTIEAKDFAITAKHKDGGTSTVKADSVAKISRKHVHGYGKTTKVKITLKNGISCETEVTNERNKIVSFDVSKYNKDKVTATLYSNGELAFEGNGEVFGYGGNGMPWRDTSNEDIRKTGISAITFGKNVKIVDGTSFFSGLSGVTYVSPLPATLVSANSMFSGCSSLKAMPDMSKCAVLRDMSSAFSDCTSLTKTSVIPASVVSAPDMFYDCTSLQKGAVFAAGSHLTDGTEMYTKCSSLTDPGVLPKKLDSMDSMFSECTNLTKMPKIPNTVTSMTKAFNSCRLLKSFTTIPSGVSYLSGCFGNCTYLSGTIRINANAEEYNGMFGGSATTTKINLVGKSKLLNNYAYTSENPQGHIYVRGHAAKDPDEF